MFGNLASEMAATWVTTPAESVIETMPSWPIVTDFVPGGMVILVSVAVGAPVSGSMVKPTT